jgi:hypothetical protein
MIVKGRDKPTVEVKLLDDGTVQFRLDFELRPDAWAEINLSQGELAALAHTCGNSIPYGRSHP